MCRITRSDSTPQPSVCARMQGATMYDIDFDTAADVIKRLRKAVKGVQVMCAVVVEVLRLALPSAAKALASYSKMAWLAMLLSRAH